MAPGAADPSDPSTRLLPRIGWLIALSLALFLALLPFSAYIASLPFIQVEWGMSNAAAAVVFSSYLIGYALSSLIVVPLTDRFPPQRVLVAGIALMEHECAGGQLRAAAGSLELGSKGPIGGQLWKGLCNFVDARRRQHPNDLLES